MNSLEKRVETIKSAIILPDVHLTEDVPTDYNSVKPFVKSFRHKKRKMEKRRYSSEVDCANKEIDFLQRYTGEVVYLAGNHEFRVDRYLDKNPEMEGMIEIPERLNLKERNIKWVPFEDQVKTPFKLGDMHFIHGLYTNKYNAQKHLQTLGCNICYGHQHSTQTAMQNMAMQKPHMAYALGTLGDKSPDYLQGKPANWINQFGVFYWNPKNGHFNLYPVNIINGEFIWGGKKFGDKKKGR